MSTLALTARTVGQSLQRLDRVWLALVLLFAGLAIFAPSQAVDSAKPATPPTTTSEVGSVWPS